MAPYPNSRNKNFNRNRGPKGLRRNERIKAAQVRVIGPEGTNLGVMPPHKALKLAKDVGLDLIEISPQARPPVCRILDLGKFLYEKSKSRKKISRLEISLRRLSLESLSINMTLRQN